MPPPEVPYDSPMAEPELDEQRAFWNSWNTQHRTDGIDEFMARQLAEAKRAVAHLTSRSESPERELRILEVGCGTGWLAAELTGCGVVTATDLSDASIEIARRRAPQVQFFAGDFVQLHLPGGFDLVVSADVIAHVADQQQFVRRIGELLRPGGLFLLMTQNGFVWRRSSYLVPQQPGQLRNWPSLHRIRQLLRPEFDILRVGTIVPGGDQGVLRPVRWTHRAARVLRLQRPWTRVLEWARIGRELVVLAQKL
jgi:2-polyprenyl-3-methyl-5-hydroxy-6-metoxy-1,4-benzoquinol methylase